MVNSTSVGYKNLPNEPVEDFLLQLPPLRNFGAVTWDVKGEARQHYVVKFGGLAANYFAANARKDPLLLVQCNREDINVIEQEIRRFFTISRRKVIPFPAHSYYLVIGMRNEL